MAAKDQKRLASDGAVRYAIQLELACEVPSLAEAWKHDRPAGSMWLLKTRHGSRDCFRVLWGRYPTLDAAKRAKGAIPAFFTTASNRPAVVSVR
jgi:septal ring-binding cell division protein DamX